MIRMTAPVALMLETAVTETDGLEFSGFGFVERQEGEFLMYDAVILDVGSSGYTEIEPELILPLIDRDDNDKMRVWIHRHPIGNGQPGSHNWSTTDEDTIKFSPLGGVPKLVKWSISIVRTPLGWVGRIDDHIQDTTLHVPVAPALPTNFILEIRALKREYYAKAYPKKVMAGESLQLQYEDLDGSTAFWEDYFQSGFDFGDMVDDEKSYLWAGEPCPNCGEIAYLDPEDERWRICYACANHWPI